MPEWNGTFAGADDVRRVPVGRDHFALVDVIDYDLVAAVRWYPTLRDDGKVYAIHPRKKKSALYMHRLIAGTPPGFVTDHVNGDGLDNRRANLRNATRSQNQGNSWKKRNPDGSPHSSQYKGVTWDKARSRWKATLSIRAGGRRTLNLGRFDDEAEAARAYDVAASAHFGEFAQLNFPEVRVA